MNWARGDHLSFSLNTCTQHKHKNLVLTPNYHKARIQIYTVRYAGDQRILDDKVKHQLKC